MPKKKKTRKQKILADMRHKVAENTDSPKVDLTVEGLEQIEQKPQPRPDRSQHSPTQSIAISGYQYLHSDLLRTVVLTFAIVASELLIGYFFF